MPSVTFLVALDVPEITPDALLGDADDITSALEGAGMLVLSVAPWARPTVPTAQPAGGFTSLNPQAGVAFAPPPPAPPL